MQMNIINPRKNEPRKSKQKKSKLRKKPKNKNIKLAVDGWNTTDADEIERRRLRGQIEKFRMKNTDPTRPYFSSFLVDSKQDRQYCVEIRSLAERINSCDCPDYRSNGLGTCKHIEYVLSRLKKFGARLFKQAILAGNPYVEIFLDTRNSTIRVLWPKAVDPKIRRSIDPFFSTDGTLLGSSAITYPALHTAMVAQPNSLNISRHIDHFIEYQQRLAQKQSSKEMFLNDVALGKRSLDVMKYPLYSYQHDGMLHLAFNERALLADEMGLGKTVQAIAACELLRRYKDVKRVLVVATASLKAEWEEQIVKFSDLSSIVIQGSRANRLRQYQKPVFFYLTNYEQVVADRADMQRLLAPDVIILDEAQRIKNWQTKTAETIKQLKSRYAFVLTGTPLENRIDDVYSIIQFLDPHIFGPLFRFNRDFYTLNENGNPVAYKNLDKLHKRLRPIMLRRRKGDVAGQLPKRTVNNYFVGMQVEQYKRYKRYEDKVARLLSQLEDRPLRKEEYEELQRWLACMRMLCDTPFILDPEDRTSPKLDELENILEELLSDPEAKILIFSEWERMLQLVRELVQKKRLEAAWHTGSVSQHKRRNEVKRFKEDPACRLFLSTDSGGLGLNLQSANIVINLDLPWNPAKLEQRIARAWRAHQIRSVQVINLVCEDSIEHRMLSLLAQKQHLFKGVLEGEGDLKEMKLPSGRLAFIEWVEALMGSVDKLAITKFATVDCIPKQQQAKVDPLSNVCNTLLTELQDDIDLLQAHRDQQSGQHTVLMVVDKNSPVVQRQIQQQAQQISADPGHEKILLETLDRQTFETIQRLARSGVLTLNVPTEILHSAPAFSAAKKELQEKRINQAKKSLEQAERKQRMAQVLSDGGFYEEAFVPLRESLGLVVQAFAWLNGKAEDHSASKIQENLLNNFVQEILIAQYGFPQNAGVLFSQLNSQNSAKICKTNPAHIKNLLVEHRELFSYVGDRLNKMLG